MKIKSGLLSALLFVLLLAGVTSCSNVIDTREPAAVSGSEGTVSFSLNSRKVSARTALPTLDMSEYTFSIFAKSDKGSEKTLAEGLASTELTQKFTLSRAMWTFTVHAFLKETSELVLEGSSKEIDLVNKNVAQVDLTLSATQNGKGSVTIPITYSTKGVGSVKVGLYDKAVGGNLVSGTEKTFSGNDITQNTDGTYSCTYTAEDLTSGTTYYALFVLYDEAGEPAGYYTEAVYIIAGETSAPVFYETDTDGKIKTDTDGNPVIDTETTAVAVEPNLFTAAVTYEAVDVENGESREIVVKNTATNKEYTLYDEDGDGLYDNAIPPGDYEIVKVITTDAAGEETTKDVSSEELSMAVSTKPEENTTVAAKLGSVETDCEGALSAKVSATLSVTAVATDDSTLAESLFSVQWYQNDSNSTTGGTAITGATETSYTLTAFEADKYVYAVVTQTSGSAIIKASTPVFVAKGTVDTEELTVTYGSGESAVELENGATLVLTLADGSAALNQTLLTVTGATDDISGEELTATARFTVTDFTATGSVNVIISVPGYDDITITGVNVSVKAAAPTAASIPQLISDADELKHIKKDCVAFERADETLEYAVGNVSDTTVWKTLSIAEIPATAGDVISVRVKATGTTEAGTYVAPSEAFTITVTEDLVGTLEVAMKRVTLEGEAKVGATLTASAWGEDSEGQPALATLVSFQWLVADTVEDDYTPIGGYELMPTATATFVIPAEYAGKAITVRAKQGPTAESPSTEIPFEGAVSGIANGTMASTFTLSYGDSAITAAAGITLTLEDGEASLEELDLDVSNVTDATAGATVSVDASAGFTSETTFTHSGTVTVTISADGYNNIELVIPVTVCAALPAADAVPALLSEYLNYISTGCVAFESAAETLEYAVGTITAETEWATVTPLEFEAAAGDVISVRVKATGTTEAGTYIAPSEAVTITVTAENEGSRILLTGARVAGDAKVGATLAVVTTPVDATDIRYEWYAAELTNGAEPEWEPIEGATAASYTIPPELAGCVIKALAEQTTAEAAFEAAPVIGEDGIEEGTIELESCTVTWTVSGTAYQISDETVALPVIVLNDGAATLPVTLTVTGAENSFGGAVTAEAVFLPPVLAASDEVYVLITADGYEPVQFSRFVTVQATKPAAPALSTDNTTISQGAVAFAAADNTLEYSVDGGVVWSDVTTAQFFKDADETAWRNGNKFLVRVKATGTAGGSGYIAPSEAENVTIATANIGTKPYIEFGTIEYTGDIALSTQRSGTTATLTVTDSSEFTSFVWKKDGVVITGETGSSLTLDMSGWATGTYNITVVATKGSYGYSATVPVSKQ